MVRATFDALKAQENPRGVASRRGKKVSEIVARRRDAASDVSETAEAAQESA
jgi:small subunit ribosomal protein S5